MPSRKKQLKNILTGLLIVLFLVAFNNYWSGQWLKSSVLSVFRKPMGAGYSFLNQGKVRITSWFGTGRLLKENEGLKSENRALVSVRLQISEMENENDFLRKELGVVKRKNLEVVLARVFNQQMNGQSGTALIDAGDKQAIKAGMPVIFAGEVIYGVVKEVYADTSLVYLITDSRISLNVKVAESGVMGRSQGTLNNGLSLELVANQEEVKPGQLVITSGLDGLPSALVVGKIKTSRTNQGGLFQKIEIEPEFKSLSGAHVFVIK